MRSCRMLSNAGLVDFCSKVAIAQPNTDSNVKDFPLNTCKNAITGITPIGNAPASQQVVPQPISQLLLPLFRGSGSSSPLFSSVTLLMFNTVEQCFVHSTCVDTCTLFMCMYMYMCYVFPPCLWRSTWPGYEAR